MAIPAIELMGWVASGVRKSGFSRPKVRSCQCHNPFCDTLPGQREAPKAPVFLLDSGPPMESD